MKQGKVFIVCYQHKENWHINVTGGRFARTGPLACLSPFPIWYRIRLDKCSYLRLLTTVFLFKMSPIKACLSLFSIIYQTRVIILRRYRLHDTNCCTNFWKTYVPQDPKFSRNLPQKLLQHLGKREQLDSRLTNYILVNGRSPQGSKHCDVIYKYLSSVCFICQFKIPSEEVLMKSIQMTDHLGLFASLILHYNGKHNTRPFYANNKYCHHNEWCPS